MTPLLQGSGMPSHQPIATPLPSIEASVFMEALAMAPAFVAGFLAFFRPVWDPDTFWHLAVGREMARTGHWLTTETFSFTALGQRWDDTEWLFHAFLFPLYRLGGDPLLVVLTAVGGLLVLGQMYRLVRIAGGGGLAFSLAALAILPVLADRIRCRPDLVTFLFMGVLAEVLWRNMTPNRTASPGFLNEGRAFRDLAVLLVILFALWANLHGGWAYGAAFLAATLAGVLLDRLSNRSLRPAHLTKAFALGMSVFLALFLTPFGWRVPWFPIKHLMAIADSERIPIEEWMPPNLLDYSGILLGLSTALLLVMALRRRPLALLLPAGLQVVLGFLWTRYPALAFSILAPLAVGEILSLRRLFRLWGRTAATVAAWAGVLGLSALLSVRAWPDARLRWDLSAWYPEVEVGFLQDHKVSGNLLNPYASGGYLTWYYYPLGRIFMDGRYFPFVGELSDYYSSLRTVDGWRRFLERRHVELALHPYPEAVMPPSFPGGPPRGVLRQLYPQADWAAVSYGNWGGLFLRRLPRWERAIAEKEYRVLAPDDLPCLRLAVGNRQVDRDALAHEIRRCLGEAPRIPGRDSMVKLLEACRHEP